MSANGKVMKLEEKKKSVNFAENKEVPMKSGIVTKITRSPPRFARHTQSSLMKTRTPISLKRSRNIRESNKFQENITLRRFSGIYKRRDSIKKQSRSVQTLKTILKREKNRRTSIFLQGSEVTEIFCQAEQCAENTFVALRSDLIKDVSRDLRRSTGSPAKLALRVKSTKRQTELVDRTENMNDPQVSLQDEVKFVESSSIFLQDSLENIRDVSNDRAIVDIVRKLQSHLSNDEEELADSHCNVKVYHKSRGSNRMLVEDFSNKEDSDIEIQMFQQTQQARVSPAADYKCDRKSRKTRKNKKINDEAALQDSGNSKSMKYIDDSLHKDIGSVVNDDVMGARNKSALQKTLIFINQRSWKPPSVNKTPITETTSLTQLVPQKSSQSIKRSIVSTWNKHSSIEHDEPFDNESTSASTSTNNSKLLMKENKDPHENCVTKICKNIAEPKQPKLQNIRTLPKRKRSTIKVASNSTNKCDDDLKSKSKQRSRHWYPPKKSPKNRNDVEQYNSKSTLIHNKRSKPSEVIHALKEIIASVTEDEDMEDNISKNHICNPAKSDSELQTLSNHDISLKISRDELNFTENKDVDGMDRSLDLSYKLVSSNKSISTQTELNLSPYLKIHSDKGDSKEISKQTRIVGTQTSSINKNTTEIGCDIKFYDIICKDAAVSCSLIDLETSVDLNVEDKMTTDVPIHVTDFSSIKYTEIDIENECIVDGDKVPFTGYDKASNIEMILKPEDYNGKEILANSTSDFITEARKIAHEETSRPSLKSSTNFDDKMNTDFINEQQESTECFNNRDANNDLIDNPSSKYSRQSWLSIHDDNVSCSSDDVTEYLSYDIQYKNTIAPLTIEDIPRDVIAAFELAAERARNLHRAVIIYRKNLMKESEERNEEIAENAETSRVCKDQGCAKKCAFYISCENENSVESDYNIKNLFVVTNDNDFDDSSSSSCDSNNDQVSETEYLKLPKARYSEIVRGEEDAIVPRIKRTISGSILRKHYNIANVKSLALVRRTQKERDLELLQLEKDESDESFEMRDIKALALPAAIKETPIISSENLFPFICCVFCAIAIWYLLCSFQCESAL